MPVPKKHRVRYDDFIIIWYPDEHRIKIIPRKSNLSATPWFGLGNAAIRFNIDHPPEKIVRPITGDSDADGLIPGKPFSLKGEWFASAGEIGIETRKLPKTNLAGENTYYEISYPVVKEGYYAEQKNKDVDIRKNGYEVVYQQSLQKYFW